ncbi:MAG: hypothetical protein KDA96_18300, partial [Planctomycetaceae bacterium]|nr:hypothetical protein [Planctomycetaceae bacterium]
MLRFLRSIFRRVPGDSPQLAIERFHRHQIDLHAAFYSLAASSGTPRDLNWLSCEWLEEFQLARESTTGLITLLTAVNVRFTAVEGGDM